MTTFSFEEVSVPVPILIRVLATPLLRHRRSLRCLRYCCRARWYLQWLGLGLICCVATERVVGVEFDGPAGACPQIGKRRHHIILCVFFIVGVRARERLSCPSAWNRHLRRLLRRVVGLRGVILEGGTPKGLSVDPIRNGDRVTGEPSCGNKPPNVFLKRS